MVSADSAVALATRHRPHFTVVSAGLPGSFVTRQRLGLAFAVDIVGWLAAVWRLDLTPTGIASSRCSLGRARMELAAPAAGQHG